MIMEDLKKNTNDSITSPSKVDSDNSSSNDKKNYLNDLSTKNDQNASKCFKETNASLTFMYSTKAHLLGLRFLKNERKGFEQEVERSMNQLVQKNLLENNDKHAQSKHLPTINIHIPNTINDLVEIEMINIHSDEEEISILNSIKNSNEEFFKEFDNEQYIHKKIISSPIRITANQLFLYRGQLNTPVERCLTMTTIFSAPNVGSNNIQPNRYQQCLVAIFDSSEKVTEILNVFRKLHGIVNYFQPLLSNSATSRVNEYKVVLNAEVEIQEELSEGKWQSCLREKDSFKLRTNVDKKIIINLQQDLTHYNYPVIKIERCFGMLLSQGRNVSSNQMVAIGLNPMSSSIVNADSSPIQKQWQIVANWIPSELGSDYLNTETPRNNRIYFTIALDLILENIEEPIRFIFESKAKIISSSVTTKEKIWKNLTNLSKNSQRYMQECFSIIVRQLPDLHGRILYEVISCLSSTQIAMQKQRLSLQLNLNKIDENSKENGLAETPNSPEISDPDDEPLQSGFGLVSKECSQNELEAWQSIIQKWNENLSIRPKQLTTFVRRGIPQALRPEVWQLLARAYEIEEKILPKYKLLVTQESSYESIISRDISRTFTAHEKFREAGPEQESLFRICKAYSNYDAEIGYCQGLSYLIAALLLNIPEEQAFCVLVQIMYHYGLRDLFKSGLENLHCKFYQLERLLYEQIPELYFHFMDLHIEAHMYASQWFLTLFTTKFPLNVVFLIIDLFLLDEMDVILQIALSFLQKSKNDLLALDFEGIMKYFRISLPKIYRNDTDAKELIQRAIKINVKKAKKYEIQYKEWREKNRDPFEILQNENKRLMETVARLEQENDDHAQEVLSLCQTIMKMRDQVDLAEDKTETLNSLLLQARTRLIDSEEHREQLTCELKNLKDMYRKEVENYEIQTRNDRKIIQEYKQICKNYQESFENEKSNSQKKIKEIVKQVESCELCSNNVQKLLNTDNSSNNGQNLNLDGTGKQDLMKKINDLEGELIKTKIALAESEDRNGQLVGKLYSTNSELNLLKAQNDERTSGSTWFSKTLLSWREGATSKQQQSQSHVKSSNSVSSGISSVEMSNKNIIDESIDNNQIFRRNSSQSDQ